MRGSRLFLVLVIAGLLIGTASADTAILFANLDGRIGEDTNSEWLTMRNAAGDGIDMTQATATRFGSTLASTTETPPTYNYHYRGFVSFGYNETMPAGSTINSATVSLRGYAKSNGLGTVNFSVIDYTGANPPTSGDYDSTTFTRQADDLAYASVGASGTWFSVSLTNLSGINTAGGNTTYIFTHSADVDAGDLVWVASVYSGFNPYNSEQADSTPYITIDFTPAAGGDTTPPASITNLAASNATCEQINWTWTDSTSDDADQVMIYKDDVFLHNVSANQTYDLWTSLTGGNTYWFNSTTCDFTGNCNVTAWQNLSETATTCSAAPVADFTANETTVCLYDYVQFTDNSTNSPDTWFWLFGDSQDSHIQNPVHYWDTAGSYTINLTAGNDAGENTTSKTDYITAVDCNPVANFTANETSVCLGDPILFMDNSTLYPAPSVFDYLDWDFGDGNTTAGFRDDGYDVPVFTYGYAGTFDVSMEITTKYGSDLLSRKAYITVTDCVGNPDFYANETCQIGVPMPVLFTGYCPYPSFKNHWDFGDGNDTDDVQSPEYTYYDYGVYTVWHSCKYAGEDTVFENKTDYIVIGVNGTVCADDCGNTTGNCTTCTGEGEGEEYPNYLLIGACIGLLFGYITIRRKEMI